MKDLIKLAEAVITLTEEQDELNETVVEKFDLLKDSLQRTKEFQSKVDNLLKIVKQQKEAAAKTAA